ISFFNLVKLYFNREEWPLLINPLLHGIFFLFRRLMNKRQSVTIVLKKLAMVVNINMGLGTVA
uniref:Uncharacterized protein n=1 Tax=Romanomermis culicivorax TaxID=13658 RepID=A0A915KSJ3_ROMCU